MANFKVFYSAEGETLSDVVSAETPDLAREYFMRPYKNIDKKPIIKKVKKVG